MDRKNKILFIVVAVAACLLATTLTATAADWTMWRGDASNTGSSSETINLPLTEQWHSTAPEIEENGVVVADGIAYITTEDNYLYAFEVSTGAVVTGYPVSLASGISRYFGTPAVDPANNKVYVLAGSYLFAFNLDGSTAWTQNVGTVGYINNEGPVIDEGYVYVAAGNYLQKYSSDGTLQWSSSTSSSTTQPAIMGNYVYTHTYAGSIQKFDKTTGAEITGSGFPIASPGSYYTVPVVADGKIFLHAGATYVYNADTGALIWQQYSGGSNTESNTPSVYNGVVYVYGWDGIIYAFDEETGGIMGGFPTVDLNPGGYRNWGTPIVSGDKIFIGAGTSQIMKVLGAAGTANAGQVLEEHLTYSTDTQGFDLCAQVISDGVVFAMLDGGGLYAFFDSGTEWTGGAITINGGASCTESLDVTLTLDKGSNGDVIEMIISEDPFFSDASWESYATTKAWTLSSGYGTKTVYVQYKDSTGTLSNVFNDQIEYSENCGQNGGEIPEFPTIVLPMAAIIGLAFFMQRRKE